MITSVHNPRIQWVRKLQSQAKERRQEGAFIVEGVRLAEEAFASGWQAQLVLHDPGLSERGQQLLAGFAAQGVPIELVAENVMEAVSDTQSPQGILVILGQRTLPLPEPLTFVLIADGLRDPGNLGTLLRTAAAAGVQAVLLPPGVVDPFSPKVVRAAMGAHFRLPLHLLPWEQIAALVQSAGLHVYLADAANGISCFQADFRLPLAVVLGSEADGAGGAARDLAHHAVHIPMPGQVESLNAAVAVAVLLFEVVRQRSQTGETRL